MTEQTGNNKPNEAEALAFPLSDNEKLIEEAAEAMLDAARELLGVETIGERPREMTREYARRAFAVFEKAHTPTEDEREPSDAEAWAAAHAFAAALKEQTGRPQMVNVEQARAALCAAGGV